MSTYAELQEQIRALQVQADTVRKQEVATVITDIRAKMQQYGLSLADLGGRGHGPRAGQTVAAKYRDPKTGSTWTGRGKAPRWLSAEFAKGKKKEDFLIA